MAIDQIHKNLGRRIKALRQQRGFSQERLAAQIDRSVETVSNIERGEVTTRLTTVAAITDALGVDISVLFDTGDSRAASHPMIQELVKLLTAQDDAVIKAVIAQTKVLLSVATQPRRSRARTARPKP